MRQHRFSRPQRPAGNRSRPAPALERLEERSAPTNLGVVDALAAEGLTPVFTSEAPFAVTPAPAAWGPEGPGGDGVGSLVVVGAAPEVVPPAAPTAAGERPAAPSGVEVMQPPPGRDALFQVLAGADDLFAD